MSSGRRAGHPPEATRGAAASIPEYVKGARVDLFRFLDTGLSAKVQSGVHAMAVDEQRCEFSCDQMGCARRYNTNVVYRCTCGCRRRVSAVRISAL
jgi:hypothetical protein